MNDQHTQQATQIKYLVQLQGIDDQLWMIKEERGTLPRMIDDLKKKIADYTTKKALAEVRLEEYQQAITAQQAKGKEMAQLVKDYEAKLESSKNDQAREVFTKELELAKLDALLAQKKVKEHRFTLERENVKITEFQKALEECSKSLGKTKATLVRIDEMNQSSEETLKTKRQKLIKSIDMERVSMYKNIKRLHRKAVVDIKQGACGGCYVMVPLQAQLNISTGKKQINCESCGRIFAYVQVLEEVEKSTKKRRKQETPA